jgi:flagellar hook assembly protein FlgD
MRAPRLIPAVIAAAALAIGTPAAAADPPVTVSMSYYDERTQYPVLTGVAESVSYRVTLNRPANVDLDIVNGEADVVQTAMVNQSLPSGNTSRTWDFTDSAGVPVADGIYTFRVTAQDSDGNTATTQWRTAIDRHPAVPILGVGEGAEVSGTLELAIQDPPDLAIRDVRFSVGSSRGSGVCRNSAVIASPDEDGYFRAPLADVEGCGSGIRYVWASFTMTDDFGYEGSYSMANSATQVTVSDTEPPSATLEAMRPIYLASPTAYESRSIVVAYSDASPLVMATYYVTDRNDNLVIQQGFLSGSSCRSSGNRTCSATWSGLDDFGHMVRAGVYTVIIGLADTQGNTTTVSGAVIVHDDVPANLAVEPDPERANTYEATVTVNPAITPTRVQVCRDTSSGCGDARFDTGLGVYTAELDYSAQAVGTYAARASITWNPDGASRTYVTETLPTQAVDSTPPTASMQTPRTLYKTGPDTYENRALTFTITDPSGLKSASYSIADSQGAIVVPQVNLTGGYCLERASATCTSSWAGRDGAGNPVPAGEYTITATFTDRADNTATTTGTLTVNSDTPGTLAVDPVAGRVNTYRATIAVDPAINPTRVQACRSENSGCVDAQRDPELGVYTAELDYAAYLFGEYAVRAAISWTPDSGERTYRSNDVTVTAVDVTPPDVSMAPVRTIYQATPTTYEPRSLTYTVTDPALLAVATYQITNSQDEIVVPEANLSGSYCRSSSSATCSATWAGRDSSGHQVPPGVYTITATFTDRASNTTTTSHTITLDQLLPGALTTPANGGILQGWAPFVYTPNPDPQAGVTITQVIVRIGTNPTTAVAIYNASPDGQWRTTFPVGTLAAGANTLVTVTSWKDREGDTHTFTAETWTVGVDPTAIPLAIEATPESGTAPVNASVAITASHPTSRPLTLSVNWGDGQVDQFTLPAPYTPPTVAHTYESAGTWTITVTAGDGAGGFASATHTITVAPSANHRPTLTLAAEPTAVIVGNDVTLRVTAQDPEGAPLTYRIAWGDEANPAAELTGTYTDALDLAHRYAAPGSYLVRAQVSDGFHTVAKNLRVTVALPEDLRADAGEDQVATAGRPVILDGTPSGPAGFIDSYAWAFGDGTSGTGPSPTHTYAQPGTYTATLTVRAGALSATDTTRITVEAAPLVPGLRIAVTDAASGAGLAGAQVVVVTPDGAKHSTVTADAGMATLFDLPDGALAVNVWAAGYLPDKATATITDGSGQAAVGLVRGDIGSAVIQAPRQLSPDELVDRGIDPGAEENNHVFEAEIRLHFVEETPEEEEHFQQASQPCSFTWWPSSWYYRCGPAVGGPGAPSGGDGEPDLGTGGGFALSGDYFIPTLTVVEGAPIVEWLRIPVRGSFMKEFFDVSLVVQNLAAPGSDAVFAGGSAHLDLPAGLSLAPVVDPARTQSPTVAMEDIPAGQARTATWTVRGDQEGEYPLAALYSAVVEPFGTSVNLTAEAPKDLKVWAGSALELSVDVDARAGRPFLPSVPHPHFYSSSSSNSTSLQNFASNSRPGAK